ncbi:MAG: tRNA (adenosine(37)-N6)-threonylcarbamoyltransferase complex ATPase subunit type 1 TsaE [Pseudomonadota bacterium]
MSRTIISRVLKSPDDTTEFAHRFAACLKAGDTILFSGGIGAGKTHFARAVIQSLLLEPEDVPSPTFTLVQTYDTSLGPLWHADLYRLTGSGDVFELGLIDAFGKEICLIEWPDRLGEDWPDAALDIALQMTATEGERHVRMTSNNTAWEDRLTGVMDV